MNAHAARRAFEQVLGSVDMEPVRLASGRTSEAWRLDVDGEAWVVRLLIPDSGRRSSFHVERRIGSLLAESGAPVAEWTVGDLGGSEYSAARMLPGTPIDSGWHWTSDFAADVADALAAVRRLPVTGWGPLADVDSELRGESRTATEGIVDRWFHATMWPFDGSSLLDHPVARLAPDVFDEVVGREREIVDAAVAPFGVVHSDLHGEHLLVTDGRLTGLLDFGDAFVGSTAWDIALLCWYYGQANAALVVEAYADDDEADEVVADDEDDDLASTLLGRGEALAVAVGLYKLAKNPADPRVVPRLRQLLE